MCGSPSKNLNDDTEVDSDNGCAKLDNTVKKTADALHQHQLQAGHVC